MTSEKYDAWQVNFIYLIVEIIIIISIVFICRLPGIRESPLDFIITYMLIVTALQIFLLWFHFKGLRLMYKQQYAQAIDSFNKSYDFLKSHKWLDNYRFLLFFSFTKINYREKALCNIALCYKKLGNVDKAREYYNLVLLNYPDNGIAFSALTHLGLETK